MEAASLSRNGAALAAPLRWARRGRGRAPAALLLASAAIAPLVLAPVGFPLHQNPSARWGVLPRPPFTKERSRVAIRLPGVRFWGAGGVLVLASPLLVCLPLAAVLRGMDPALEESARSLGMGAWRTFFRVPLPQTRIALLGGMLLV